MLVGLFDFYFVQPAAAERKRTALNKKLEEAGKPPMKKREMTELMRSLQCAAATSGYGAGSCDSSGREQGTAAGDSTRTARGESLRGETGSSRTCGDPRKNQW